MSQDFWTATIAVALVLVAIGLMTLGWRNRIRRQGSLFDSLPAAPADPGALVLGPLSGVYVGSTVAGDWQARIARAPLGHRSAATLTAYTGGLLLELATDDVWIPRESLVDVRRASALANKTVPGGGILVARWQVASTEGHTLIDSGFRADDKDDYQRWEALRGDAGASDTTGIPTSSTEENQ